MHYLFPRDCSRKAFLLLFCFAAATSFAQQPATHSLIVQSLNEDTRAPLSRSVHPLAQPKFDQGAAPDDLPMHRMLLLLARSPQQQLALEQLLVEQQEPDSPNYRRWLTPTELGQRFGPAESDLRTLVGWLEQHGFTVENLASARNLIEISGTAAQFQSAFRASLRRYAVNGRNYWANADIPSIPAALAPLVRGFASLNNFPHKRLSRPAVPFVRGQNGGIAPYYTVTSGSQTYYAIAPADFSTIYNTAPLLQSGINGSGQTIAVLGRSNVHLSDIADFRTLFSLGTGNISVVIDGADPGIVSDDEGESVLDLEWASAVAPGASVILVSAADTNTTSGLDLAAEYAIEHNLATVISESYGICEAYLGDSGNTFMEALWQQAAAQGISVTVASGDSGSALCDNPSSADLAQSGLAVNGLASTSYNVAVGGTDFDDIGTQSTFWNPQNALTTHASALSYIPETTWNESCAAAASASNLNVCPILPALGTPPSTLNLWAASGGASNCVTSTGSGSTITCGQGRAKPTWQAGPGVPADGVRDLPDVTLFSAANSSSRSFYVVCQADQMPAGSTSCKTTSAGIYFLGTGGTSAAAPGFAGIIALAAQKAGTRLGNFNSLLYSLAADTGASCASAVASAASCIFHDIIKGNIAVPRAAGSPACSVSAGNSTGILVSPSRHPAYEAASGYDLASGLGSVNAATLAAAVAASPIPPATTTTSLSLNGSANALTARHGDALQINVAVSPAAASGTVSISSSALVITSSILSSGTAAWASRLFPGGSYSILAHYAGDNAHAAGDSNNIALTVAPEPSRTLINLVTLDPAGAPLSYGNTSLAYGSNYLLRVDVGDAAILVSNTQAPSSTCTNGIATCPTGATNLTANGSALGSGSFALSHGSASITGLQLPAGAYHIAASYGGDLGYAQSSGSADIAILKASTTVTAATSAPATVNYGMPLNLTAQLATSSYGASPAGTLTMLDNGVPIGSSLQSITQLSTPGSLPQYAALTYSSQYLPPSLGTHNLLASYAGDANYANSVSAPISFTTVPAATFMSTGTFPATVAPGAPVTLTATIATSSALEQPTGTVSFYDNGTLLSGTVSYRGNAGPNASLTASLTMSFTSLGPHSITAGYPGDVHYKAASLALGTLLIQQPFGLSLPVSQVQSSGGAGSTLLTVANHTSAPLSITLACASNSTRASCALSPTSLTLAASSSITASVVYTVPALSAAGVFPLGPVSLILLLIAIGGGMCIKSLPHRLLLLLLLTAALVFASACGGGATGQQSNPANGAVATAQTYSFTIRGSGGSYTDTQILSVAVH